MYNIAQLLFTINVTKQSIQTLSNTERDNALYTTLEGELIAIYGPLVSGKTLQSILAYPSQAAFRQAAARNLLPVPVFCIEHRRGKFALVRDIAAWLSQRRNSVDLKKSYQGEKMHEP